MQDKLLMAGMEFLLVPVHLIFIPEIQEIRFPLGKSCPHREIGFRQV